jgi:hypothetical protein
MTDKEIKQRLREIETRKVHQCAMALKAKGLFTGEELRQTLKEYGVAYAYFEQLYHLDWRYEWIKEDEMTFEEFIRDFIFKTNGDRIFRDSIDADEYVNRYRLNGNKVEHYEQQYRYRVAFQKKEFLNI